MLKCEIIGGDRLAVALGSVPAQVQGEIQAAIGRSLIRLQRHIMAGKLSGQVLKVQTGNLRRSIDQVLEHSGNQTVGTVFTNVKYGLIHEYGFQGTQNVRAHLRQVKQAFGKPLKAAKTVQIAAHPRKVALPERSFLRSALRDLLPEIQAELNAAAEKAVS